MTLKYTNNVKLQLRRTIELENAIYTIDEATFPSVLALLSNLDKSLFEYARLVLFNTYLRGDQSSKFVECLWNQFSPAQSLREYAFNDSFQRDKYLRIESIVRKLDQTADEFPIIGSILKDDLQQFQAQFNIEDVNKPFSPASNTNPIDTLSMSYFDIACYFGAINICRFLKDNDAKLSKDTLVNVVKSGNLELYKLVETNNCDIEKLMKVALNYNRTDILLYLYDKIKGSRNYLDQALLFRNTRLFRACLKFDEDENTCQMSPLAAAVIAGNIDVAKIYIENGYSVNLTDPDDIPAYILAAQNGDLPMLKMMHEANVINQNMLMEQFQIAMDLNHWENAEYLASKFENVSSTRNVNFLLFKAIEDHQVGTVRNLCMNHPNFQLVGPNGLRTMETALIAGDINIVNVLLEFGDKMSNVTEGKLGDLPNEMWEVYRTVLSQEREAAVSATEHNN